MSRLILPRRDLIVPTRHRQRGFIINPYAFGAGAPPTDPYFSSVSLLIHGNGPNNSTTITDSSSYGHTVNVRGGAKITTAVSKFGGSCIALLSSGDWLDIASHAAFGFGSGDYTAECWYYRNASSGNRCLIDTRTASNAGFATLVSENSHANSLCYIDNTGSLFLGGTGGFTLGAFEHQAMCRQGTTVYGYLGGVANLSGTDSRTLASASSIFIGDNFLGSSQPVQGFVAEIRVTKGICRYPNGTTFTPPTGPFPNS